MKFKPNGNWVILPNPAKKKTDSGIILDDKTVNQMKTNILTVEAVGPQCFFANPGDTVMIDPRMEALMVELDDKNYIMIPEHQILGVM